jgi:hypothetical protein
MNESTPSTSIDKVRRWLSNKRTTWMVAVSAPLIVVGLSVGLAVGGNSGPPPASSPTSDTAASGASNSNARSAPSAGGAAGAISTTSNTGLSLTTSAGQTVTVSFSNVTKFDQRSTKISRNSLRVGQDVLVYGTTNNTNIVATQVVVDSSGSTLFKTSSAVISFTRGSPTDLKEVGALPAGWTQGSGTIISGTSANEATDAALEKYPGGVVDRVVRLTNGEYNVHYIGVNWPHHIFVSQDFKVVGAE